MKKHLLIFLFIYAPHSFAAGVITCGDAMAVGAEANASLHKAAQRRAQNEIEDFAEKKLTKPYIAAGGFEPVCGGKKCKMTGTPETTAKFVETFWCETSLTPLHSAYFRFYTSSKDFFDKRYLP